MASCSPMGRPHCTRAFDHLRQSSRQAFTVPAVAAGSVRRPVLSVVRAMRSPCPSSPSRFSLGILTSRKLIWAFARARSPMK